MSPRSLSLDTLQEVPEKDLYVFVSLSLARGISRMSPDPLVLGGVWERDEC